MVRGAQLDSFISAISNHDDFSQDVIVSGHKVPNGCFDFLRIQSKPTGVRMLSSFENTKDAVEGLGTLSIKAIRPPNSLIINTGWVLGNSFFDSRKSKTARSAFSGSSDTGQTAKHESAIADHHESHGKPDDDDDEHHESQEHHEHQATGEQKEVGNEKEPQGVETDDRTDEVSPKMHERQKGHRSSGEKEYHVFFTKVPTGQGARKAGKVWSWHGELKFCPVPEFKENLHIDGIEAHLTGNTVNGIPEVDPEWWKGDCHGGDGDACPQGESCCKPKESQAHWDDDENKCEVLTYGKSPQLPEDADENNMSKAERIEAKAVPCSGVKHYREPLFEMYPWLPEDQHLYYQGKVRLPDGGVKTFRESVMCPDEAGADWAARKYSILRKNCNTFAGSALKCLKDQNADGEFHDERPYQGFVEKRSMGTKKPRCPSPEHPVDKEKGDDEEKP
jgi:hypothetical protein